MQSVLASSDGPDSSLCRLEALIPLTLSVCPKTLNVATFSTQTRKGKGDKGKALEAKQHLFLFEANH
jgi:hypothetical protein